MQTGAPTASASGSPTSSTSASGSTSASASPSASGSASASAAASGTGAALGPEAVAAFQGALSAEHAAVYGYGVVGARLPEDQRTDARTAYAAHQARRDAWQRLVSGTGATPSAAAAGYQLPFAVTDAAGAAKLAAHLETRLTTVYADLVTAVTGAQRTAAADALRESALRAKRWGAAPIAFPGLPDPATGPTGSPTGSPSGSPTGSAAPTPSPTTTP
ncbi:ferritin-like domain-containing protein [Kitasatospora sp. NPDC052868]|uniref:ferritin-like domain-containing protein n=1 Tax=Kitasatospora sp. NPDC052868 TaxID=3364060 RepID=UPI0037C8228D